MRLFEPRMSDLTIKYLNEGSIVQVKNLSLGESHSFTVKKGERALQLQMPDRNEYELSIKTEGFHDFVTKFSNIGPSGMNLTPIYTSKEDPDLVIRNLKKKGVRKKRAK